MYEYTIYSIITLKHILRFIHVLHEVVFIFFFPIFVFTFSRLSGAYGSQQDPSNIVEKYCRLYETSFGPNRNAFVY